MWEESPIGTWTLEVQNDGRSVVELKSWSLAFLGTETHPQPNHVTTSTTTTTQKPTNPTQSQSGNVNQEKQNITPQQVREQLQFINRLINFVMTYQIRIG